MDVGANTGQHSLLMSRYSREVHAFEPYQPVLARFQEMIADNNLVNIRVHPFGLGNEEATLQFFEPPESNQGTGSFIEGFKNNNQSAGELQLEIKVGDKELGRLEVPRVDLIKMDIEGYEKLALLGLKQTIRAFRPIVIMDPALKATFKSESEVRDVFPERYELRRLISESNALGHYSLHEFEPDFDTVRQFNLVLYPSEKAKFLKQANY